MKMNDKLLANAEEGKTSQNVERQTTFAEGIARKSTFSRTFTFDGAYIREGLQAPITGITRTLTDIGNAIDPDAKFTKAAIEDYSKIAVEGNEGDIPFPDGYCNTYPFLKVAFWTLIVGCIMGVMTAAFMNFTDEVPRQWFQCDIENDPECTNFNNGHFYFLWITTGGGFVIGLIRWAFFYPVNLPGLFKDVQSFHVDPKWIVLTFTISALSLGCGASLGPEQALGNMGGGIAYFITQHVKFADEEYNKIFVLAGMAGPLGALLPSPMLGALMMHEMGEPPKHFMESTIILSLASVACFAVFYEMIGVTYLDYQGTESAKLGYEWLEYGYDTWQIGTAVVIGIICAILGVVILIAVGFAKQLFFRIRARFPDNAFLREVLPPAIGGLIIGSINIALPGTVGNGNLFMHAFIKYGASTASDAMSPNLILCTGFARMLTLGISMNCGFVGGIIYPFVSMGVLAGAYMYKFYSYLPRLLCTATFMVALPCTIVPLPFTFTCLAVFIYYLGIYQTVPIFVSCVVAYALLTGTGVLKRMVNRSGPGGANGAKPAPAPSNDEKKAQAEKDKASKEADDYAMAQYLSRQKGVHAAQ